MIMVEGNIGSGKSTFVSKFDPIVTVKMENISEIMQLAFYTDPEVYGPIVQFHMLPKRMMQAQSMYYRGNAVLDRSVIGDYAFALWNTAIGNLDATMWSMYRREAGETPSHAIAKIGTAPVICYLHETPVQCQHNVQTRNGPDRAISLGYLQGIAAAHLICLASLPVSTRIIVLHRDEHWNEDYIDITAIASHALATRPMLAELAETALLEVSDLTARVFLQKFWESCRK